MSLHSTLTPGWQGRGQGQGSKAGLQAFEPLSMEWVRKSFGGAGAEPWMCQAMKPLLTEADSKQMQEWEDSWEAQVQFGTEQL